MKYISRALLPITIICFLTLSACIPIQGKNYQQPISLSGKNCVQQCYSQQNSCNEQICSRNNSCDSSQQMAIDLQKLRDPAGNTYGNDFDINNYGMEDCSDRFEDCFQGCGGTIGQSTLNNKPTELLLYGALAVAMLLLNQGAGN